MHACLIWRQLFFKNENSSKSQQLQKGISVITANVNDQNVLQKTYLLAVQLTLSLGGQLTLETFWLFLKCLIFNLIYDSQ